jgi:hypothetical protein
MLPSAPTDTSLFENLCLLLWAMALGWFGVLLYRHFRRTRPHLDVGFPLIVGAALRVGVAAAISLTSYATTLRGPDEQTWLENASSVTRDGPFSELGLKALTKAFHVWVIGTQGVVGPVPELALRFTQIAFSMAGVLLIVLAVHDLSGRRAAGIAAWALALEPSGVFFSSLLLKEPILLFAGGLALYGGAKTWRLGGTNGVLLMVFAGAVAVATRPYAGWFLVTACVVITLHAGIRNAARRPSGFAIGVGIVLLISAMIPVLGQLSSKESLERLQSSQSANAADNSNLKLEFVDFSTRENVARNLPDRVADVVFRPYPWQVDNLNQQLGAFGSLGALLVFYLLIQGIARTGTRALARIGPIAYIALALLVAYSLSAGNAGTSFRYRTHLVALSLAAVVILRDAGRVQRRVYFRNWNQARIPLANPVPPGHYSPRSR